MSSKQRLLDLINNTNFPPIPLSDSNVVLQQLQPAAGGAQWNTSVQVVAIDGQGYSGSRTHFYRRLDLSVLGNLSITSAAAAGDAQALVDLINARTAADLGLDDFQAFTVPVVGQGLTQTLVLAAEPGSYRWIGTMSVQITGEVVFLPKASVADAVLEADPVLFSSIWDPQPLLLNGAVVAGIFGQMSMDNGSGVTASATGAYQLPDDSGLPPGTLMHYYTTEDASLPEQFPGATLAVLAPPGVTTVALQDQIDPVAQADWIAAYNAALPFHIPVLNAQNQAEFWLYFDQPMAADSQGQWYLPQSYQESNALWPASAMHKYTGVQTPFVLNDQNRQFAVFATPVLESTVDAASSQILSQQILPDTFGQWGERVTDTPATGQNDELMSWVDADHGSTGVLVKFLPAAAGETADSAVWLKYLVSPGEAGPRVRIVFDDSLQPVVDGTLGDGAVEQQKFQDWWNTNTVIGVSFLDIAGNVIASRVFSGGYGSGLLAVNVPDLNAGVDSSWSAANLQLVRSVLVSTHGQLA